MSSQIKSNTKSNTKSSTKISKKLNTIGSKRLTSKSKSKSKTYNKTYKLIKMFTNIKQFNEFYKKLNAEEKDALQNYKQFGYIILNQYLYNETIKNLKFNDLLFNNSIKKHFSNNTKDLFSFKNIDISNIPKFVEFYVNKNIINKINVIDKIFTKDDISKLNGSEILFRGTRGHTGTTDKSKIGDEVIFKNFLSSSTEKEVSMNFSSYADKKDICCMYVLSGLKNIPYIYLPWSIQGKLKKILINNSEYDEFEYLLPRNLKFKITNITKGIKDSNFNSLKKLTFEQLENLLKKKNLDKMNNTDIENIIEKIFNKIKFIHLEYIEQLPIVQVQPYIYSDKLHLQFNKNFDVQKQKQNTVTNNI